MSHIDQEMWQDFVVEAEENLQEIEPNLLLIEQESDNISLLNDCFRNMHSIKGAANYMGLANMATLSHRIETLFDKIREGKVGVDYKVMDAILAGTDRLKKLTEEVAENHEEKSGVSDILERLDLILNNKEDVEIKEKNSKETGDETTPEVYSDAEPELDEDPELTAIYREEMLNLYEHLAQTTMHGEISFSAVQDILGNMARVTNYVARDWLLEKINTIREKLRKKEKEGITASEAAKIILKEVERVLSEDMGDRFKPAVFKEPETSTSIEEDEELYTIFLDFVRETAWPLANVPERYNSRWLAISQEAVEKLKTSANYMDYTEVANLLEEWEEIIVQQLTRETLDPAPLNELWHRFLSLLPGLKADDPAFINIPEDFNIDFSEDDSKPQKEAIKPQEGVDIEHIDINEEAVYKEEEDNRLQVETSGPISNEMLSKLAGEDVALSSGPNRAEMDILEFEAETGGRARPKVTTKQDQQSVRVDLEKIESILEEVGELVILRSALTGTVEQMKGLYGSWMERRLLNTREIKPFKESMLNLVEQTSILERVVGALQDGVMRMRMFPIENLFSRFPRMVRDLSHKLEKEIELVIEGAETELDKRVMEQMVDPLQHIIRNAVSHGIETPSERRIHGKPPGGTIRLIAGQEGNSVTISIIDDGKGLDRKAIADKALAKGLINEKDVAHLDDASVWDMIFMPGISTAREVSDVAGRGVGMDVVKQNVEKIGGSISIKSVSGHGTSIKIKIPLTLAIIQALLVKVGKQKMAVPLSAVQETFRIFAENISIVDGQEIISVRQDTMPLIRLGNVFQGTGSMVDQDKLFVVRTKLGEIETCLGVDALLGQEEIVIKPLAEYLTDQPGFSGATVLGDGSIALIVDISAIMDRAKKAIVRQRQNA